MSYEKRDNSGIISKNDRKEEDRHPDIKGSATVDGRDYWISGWSKRNDRGAFYSLSFKLKDQQSGPGPAPARAMPPVNGGRAQLDDDIPF